MFVSEYVKSYTSGEPVLFWEVLSEVKEFLVELVKFNRSGIKEEGGDVLHFFQLWLFWQFRIDGNIWRWSQCSVDKFMKRVRVWREIYAFVGLDKNISNFAGNYKKPEKVIKQLSRFGISPERAQQAYDWIVLEQK